MITTPRFLAKIVNNKFKMVITVDINPIFHFPSNSTHKQWKGEMNTFNVSRTTIQSHCYKCLFFRLIKFHITHTSNIFSWLTIDRQLVVRNDWLQEKCLRDKGPPQPMSFVQTWLIENALKIKERLLWLCVVWCIRLFQSVEANFGNHMT